MIQTKKLVSTALVVAAFLVVLILLSSQNGFEKPQRALPCNGQTSPSNTGIIVSAYFVEGVDAQRPDERRLTIAEYGADFFESIVRTGNKVIVFTDDEHVTEDPAIQKWMEQGDIEFLIREIDPLQTPHNQRFQLYHEYLHKLPLSKRPSFLMFSDLDVAYGRDPFQHMQDLSLKEGYNVFALLEGFQANQWEGRRQTACFGSHLPPGYDDHRGAA
eukprot:CFRG4157T1